MRSLIPNMCLFIFVFWCGMEFAKVPKRIVTPLTSKKDAMPGIFNTSEVFVLDKSMIITDSAEFKFLRSHYRYLLASTFTAKQLSAITEITLADAEGFLSDTTKCQGQCISKAGQSYILVAVYGEEPDKVMIHEACHALFSNRQDVWKTIQTKWMACNAYVSDYAKKNVAEDFAETGAFLLTKGYMERCDKGIEVKLRLFLEFYKKTSK